MPPNEDKISEESIAEVVPHPVDGAELAERYRRESEHELQVEGKTGVHERTTTWTGSPLIAEPAEHGDEEGDAPEEESGRRPSKSFEADAASQVVGNVRSELGLGLAIALDSAGSEDVKEAQS